MSAGPPGSVTSPLVNVAIASTGRITDPTVTQIGATAFLNGLNTLTQGVDFDDQLSDRFRRLRA